MRSGRREVDSYHVYEIFESSEPGDAFVHVGDIEAPDPEAALFFAKEQFLRREPASGLWVVDRRDIHAAEWPFEVLNSGSLKRYRRTPGRSGRASPSASPASDRDERDDADEESE